MTSKWQGHVVLLHFEIPYFTVLSATALSMESYQVFRTKKVVYCWPGFSELKIESSASAFGIGTEHQNFKNLI